VQVKLAVASLAAALLQTHSAAAVAGQAADAGLCACIERVRVDTLLVLRRQLCLLWCACTPYWVLLQRPKCASACRFRCAGRGRSAPPAGRLRRHNEPRRQGAADGPPGDRPHGLIGIRRPSPDVSTVRDALPGCRQCPVTFAGSKHRLPARRTDASYVSVSAKLALAHSGLRSATCLHLRGIFGSEAVLCNGRYLWGGLARQAHRRGLLLPSSKSDTGSAGARQRQVSALLRFDDATELQRSYT
jgi:hypothetical protein